MIRIPPVRCGIWVTDIAVVDWMHFALTSPQTPLHLSLTLSCKERGEEVYFY
jgi:hypothetical protein